MAAVSQILSVTATEGAWCPILPPRLRARWIKSGKLIYTDDGAEKRCNRCNEYWPLDTEFWWPQRGKGAKLHTWCRACCNEWRRNVRAGAGENHAGTGL